MIRHKRFLHRPRHAVALQAILPAAIAVLAGGCSGDMTTPEQRDEIVVYGYLYVGETVDEENAIMVSRTRPVDEFFDPADAVVSGAEVTLRSVESGETHTLAMTRPGYYSNPGIQIEPMTTYRLEIVMDGQETITATTTTPVPFTMHGTPRESPAVMRHEDIPDSFAMTLECEDSEQIFLLDVYCLEDWRDARYINPFGDHDRPDDYDEYGRDNGEPRHIDAFFRIKNVEKDGDLFRIDFYSAMMVYYGRYDLQILSIDDNYYNYLYREHPELSGGINGGIGVFGSACRERYGVAVD